MLSSTATTNTSANVSSSCAEFLDSLDNPSKEPPSFTTPSLDFSTHSAQLQHVLEQLYDFRDNYWTLFPARNGSSGADDVNAEMDLTRLSAQKEQRILNAMERVLERLNILTRPPTKRKKTANGNKGVNASAVEMENSNDVKEETAHQTTPAPHKRNTPTITSTHNFDPTLSTHQKAFYHYLRGHLYNILPSYHPQAEENLSKAVKMNPRLYTAWVSLGTCLFKKGDLSGAKRCYETAVATEELRSENFEALRLLAMVMRQMGNTPQERREAIERSLELSKEAVRRRPDDGLAWFGLANAHSKLFFEVSFLQVDLERAVKCLNKALSFTSCQSNADIYYSRGSHYHFMENYPAAIQDYTTAAQLDPTIMGGMAVGARGVIGYLRRLQEAVQKKANMKPKKASTVQSELAQDLPEISFTADKTSKTYQVCPLSALSTVTAHSKATQNVGKAIRVRLVGEVMTGYIMRGFVGIDSEGTCFALSVFHLSDDVVKVGDELIVGNPEVIDVCVSTDKDTIAFKSLRVDNPLWVLVNGRRIGAGKVTWTEVRLNAKDH